MPPAASELAAVTVETLGVRTEVASGDEALIAPVRALYRGCTARGEATHSITVGARAGDGQVLDVWVDGEWVAAAADADGMLLHVAWEIDRATCAASPPGPLLLHAALAVRSGRGVLISGPSGAGKSTLACALARRGFGFGGDELIGVDRDGRAVANPRPVKLDARSAVLLGLPGAEEWPAAERLVIPAADLVGAGDSVEPALVMVVQHTEGVAADVEPLRPAELVMALAQQSFDFERWGGRGLARLARVADRVTGLRLRFGALDAALDLIDELARDAALRVGNG
jgi:hypothetical protein